jgi:hypothetical protein
VEALPLAYKENKNFRAMGLTNLEVMTTPWIRRITEVDRSIDERRAKTIAVLMYSMVERSAYQQIRGTFSISKDELLDELTGVILAGVSGAARRSRRPTR